MSEVYVAVERSDGSVAHIAVQLVMRMSGPIGSKQEDQLRSRGWYADLDAARNVVWVREDGPMTIEREVRRFEQELWQPLDGLSVVRWRRLSIAEHEVFNAHRGHRDALEMKPDGSISHNMPKARELHRHLLRHQRAEKLLILDAEYNGAVAAGRAQLAADVDTKRQELRDLTDDPRIEAAQTIEELVQVGFTEDGEQAMVDLRSELLEMRKSA